MTVSTDVRTKTFVATGDNTPQSLGFPCAKASDLRVIATASDDTKTVLTMGTHYNIGGTDAQLRAGLGTIIPINIASGLSVLVERRTRLRQTYEIKNAVQLNKVFLEQALDDAVMRGQDDTAAAENAEAAAEGHAGSASTSAATAKAKADEAVMAAKYAEEFSDRAYSSIIEGQSKTDIGHFFRVIIEDTNPAEYKRYQRTNSGSIEVAPLATTLSLASSDSGLGRDLIGEPTVSQMLAAEIPARGEGAVWHSGNFQYVEVADDAEEYHLETAGGVKLIAKPFAGKYVDVQFGITGAGDERAKLQRALDAAAKAKVAFYQTQKIYIAPTLPIIPLDGVTWEFGPFAKIELLAHNTSTYNVIFLINDDITLIRPNVDARRDLNIAVGGEHGHGIAIRGARRANIFFPKSINCWGDAYYIGRLRSTDIPDGFPQPSGLPRVNEDVQIFGAIGDNCRRQGISITCGKRLRIHDPILTNISGTAPAAGIDIEPNSILDTLEDVKIFNPHCETTDGASIIIHLGTITPASGDPDYMMDILIDGARLIDGFMGFGCKAIWSNAKIKGQVRLINPVIERPETACLVSEDYYSGNNLRIVILNPDLVSPAQRIGAGGGDRTFIAGRASPAYPDEGFLRGFDIFNPRFLGDVSNVARFITFDDTSMATHGRSRPSEMRIFNPLILTDLSAVGEAGGRGMRAAGNVWADDIGSMPSRVVTTSVTLAYPNDFRDVLVNNVSGTLAVTLPAVDAGAMPYKIKWSAKGGTSYINLPSGGTLLGETGNRLTPPAAGAWIEMVPLADNIWDASKRSAGWTLSSVT